ncbi:hypothetical protein [Paenibacillus etheri]|uniref:hypothetical protein n=1 Tax=Paenibacillus etheri TaxID=1306852 RepID=UPI0012E39076|nr:hypothetical protein [Paenibacillus etheri]
MVGELACGLGDEAIGLSILLNKRLFIEGTEKSFGTVEALAFAFILGFLPREAV